MTAIIYRTTWGTFTQIQNRERQKKHDFEAMGTLGNTKNKRKI